MHKGGLNWYVSGVTNLATIRTHLASRCWEFSTITVDGNWIAPLKLMHARTHTTAQVWKRSMTCHWDFQKSALLQPPKNNHLTGKVNSAATAFSPNCKLSTPRSCRTSRSTIVLARCVARACGIYPRRSTEVLRAP